MVCTAAFTPRAVLAQVDPRGPLRTITTPHFRVHFRVSDSTLARRAASVAETAHAQLSTELVAPRGRIDLAISNNTDASNGFAQVFPNNRIVIYAVPPVTIQELRFQDDWLELVVTHELSHIFHLDRARGIWSLGRAVFGRNPLLFPNQLTPSWVKEGLAVYYESKFTGSGRNVSTDAPLVLRAAARDSAIPPISRWSGATTRFPLGQTAYAYGAQLMQRAANGSPLGMRGFVDRTAKYPIPFFLNARAREGFGTSFTTLFDRLRDSLITATAALDRAGDAKWQTVSSDGWFADAPRWRGNDTLLWAASNGREVAGLYEASVRQPGRAHRVARRNGIDVNTPLGEDSVLFSQVDFTDPFTVRYDLYTGRGSTQHRLTRGARLTQPDVRHDGNIVAVQLGAASARLVRLSRFGGATTITPITRRNLWAEPRWSPDGRFIAAAELLPNGDQRIVVLDSNGVLLQVVAGARAVFASPSFTPGGRRLVWASDRSGRMQLETAALDPDALGLLARQGALPDTVGWRSERESVRVASSVTTGVFQPTVSPDGRTVAALLYRVDGFHVAVASLDTAGPVARGGWYPEATESASAARRAEVAVARETTAPATGYGFARQLLPRYWFPEIGSGRDNGATYGFSTSASDILVRHDWFASATVNPRSREVDASAAYRYRGLGIPVVDFAASQRWDATFRATDTTNRTLGFIARRRRFASVATSFARPRVRLSLNGGLGAQYEWRDFTATVDSVLGPSNSLLRSGTRYPSVFASGSLSTLRRAGRGIAYEEGYTLSAGTAYRWRQDAPSLGSLRSIATARVYFPLDLPGFARHVLSARVTGGYADTKTATEFAIGGVSGLSAELVPGVRLGDPSRSFPVRGVEPDAQRGIRAVGATLEYRVPLLMLRDIPSPFTVYTDRVSLTAFSDAGRATCPAGLARTGTPVCERPGRRDGWIASVGGELSIDIAVQYDVPYRLRLGGAVPVVAPTEISRKGRFYVTLGSYF